MRKGVFLLIALALALPTLARAQSMAEAARKAKKERTGNAKVYTQDDLGKLRARGEIIPESETPETAASPSAGKAGDKPAAKSDDELRAEKKALLEKHLADQEGVIERIRKLDEDAQRELSDPNNLGMVGGRRAALMKIIEDDKQHIADAQAKIEEVREEARRAGIALSH
jgi:hypothetical protein